MHRRDIGPSVFDKPLSEEIQPQYEIKWKNDSVIDKKPIRVLMRERGKIVFRIDSKSV
jgi:hypothetical protein